MKQFQKIALALSASILIMGCQSIQNKLKTSQPLKPNTAQHLIEEAKAELDQYEEFDVSDEGMITFTAQLPRFSRYTWDPVSITESSYQIACEDLRYFTERGFVIKTWFAGPRGRAEYYNMTRCEEEASSRK
ncbi:MULTISPECIES: hypothetical protein [Vibrio harveyi group]|uniref:hypothetical protein n=1 Tax=Vibrio harveyi group TaxID=717610 RepID=UPI00039E9D50|nr:MULTISPECIES: hypothetical protein [Vibrio harveyi group]PAW08341.1 hypothetical protein B6K85_22885 [Vibrio sp. V1B]PQJ58380.1 hypothetical protein BTO01_21670 [Vibrio jasicida]